MENNKYYTPTIEEFHVGFEFEVRGSEDASFEHRIADWAELDMTCDDYEHSINIEKLYRVKYLDKEDIESLGWEFTGKTIDIWFKKEGIFHAISGGHKFTEYKLHYGLHDHCLYINAYFGGTDEGRLFEGIIKNKSELKRLMKQLGINE